MYQSKLGAGSLQMYQSKYEQEFNNQCSHFFIIRFLGGSAQANVHQCHQKSSTADPCSDGVVDPVPAE